jgi:hypothetical protein
MTTARWGATESLWMPQLSQSVTKRYSDRLPAKSLTELP